MYIIFYYKCIRQTESHLVGAKIPMMAFWIEEKENSHLYSCAMQIAACNEWKLNAKVLSIKTCTVHRNEQRLSYGHKSYDQQIQQRGVDGFFPQLINSNNDCRFNAVYALKLD